MNRAGWVEVITSETKAVTDIRRAGQKLIHAFNHYIMYKINI